MAVDNRAQQLTSRLHRLIITDPTDTPSNIRGTAFESSLESRKHADTDEEVKRVEVRELEYGNTVLLNDVVARLEEAQTLLATAN
ncbi:hypothetical protein Q9L58_008830 [Maublancomyces gigas]|uniref:Uncharacterized protein n=1 Tax=Discina gigas TaxID=1032678 RepID=A0ABR3G8M6_9PEZI